MCASLGVEAGGAGDEALSTLDMPCLWKDATYVTCRSGGSVASAATVTAIGRGADGWRYVIRLDVVDTEGYDLRAGSPPAGRGAKGAWLAAFDSEEGFRRVIAEVFQDAV